MLNKIHSLYQYDCAFKEKKSVRYNNHLYSQFEITLLSEFINNEIKV